MSSRAGHSWHTGLLLDPDAQAAAVTDASIVAGWAPNPDVVLREIVADLERMPDLRVFATEFDSYGSGYASYVEAKLTRRDGSLVVADGDGLVTRGFGLLLCRLAPIAVLQAEAEEWRAPQSRSASLPSREGLSELPVAGFPESRAVSGVLKRHGYSIVDPEPLVKPIATDQRLDTFLGEPPWTTFDAWFHWYE